MSWKVMAAFALLAFEGTDAVAAWSKCTDRVERTLRCEPWFPPGKSVSEGLSCSCLEDGAEKRTFKAVDPPLASRPDATRLATANCGWTISSK